MKTVDGANLGTSQSSPPHLILASSSPRRVELLRAENFQFQIVSPGIEESTSPQLTPRELSLLNAKRKAQAVAVFSPEAIVIGADTVVCIDGRTLGKPSDLVEAQEMLELLRGRTHEVVTGVWITRVAPACTIHFFETTEVTFHPLNSAEITSYLGKINPLDKAGGYAAQEYAEEIIAQISGSRTNVIGLPMERLTEELARFS